MSELGERLAELRLDNQERQKDIARLLHVSSGSVSNYETGAHLPTVESLSVLAGHYHVTMDYLMGRTNCRIGVETLNREIVEGVSFGTFIEKLEQLPEHKRKMIVEIIDDVQISCYLKNQANK